MSTMFEIAKNAICAGYIPLPSKIGAKKPIGKWEQLSDNELEFYFGKYSNLDLGIIIPENIAVLDIDIPGDNHSNIDLKIHKTITHELYPLIFNADLPCEATPSGGRHYFGTIPEGWKGKRDIPFSGVQLLQGKCFVKIAPSKGYHTLEEVWPVPVSNLPAFPEAILKLFSCEEPTDEGTGHTTKVNYTSTLEEYLDLAPGLRRTADNKYIGTCPFHDDNNASWGILRGKNGIWRWQCFAKCPGSAIKYKNGIAHGGDIEDLKRLLRIPKNGEEYTKARAVIAAMPDSLGKLLLNALIAIAEESRLSLHLPIGASYRRISEKEPRLDTITRDNQLLKCGRYINKAKQELTNLGLTVSATKPFGWRKQGTTLWEVSPLLNRLSETFAGYG